MDERIQKYEEKMKKTLASLESELVTIRAGRANPHILFSRWQISLSRKLV